MTVTATLASLTKDVFVPASAYLATSDFLSFSTQDERMRAHAQSLVERSAAELGAKAVTIAVFDVRTRTGVAFASSSHSSPDEYLTQQQEPGSIVTPILIAAGLDIGLLKTTTQLRMREIPDAPIRDAYDSGEPLTLEDVIVRSSNRGAVAVGQVLGPRTQAKYLNETSLPVSRIDHSQLTPIRHATHSYGYGFATTPRNIVLAYAHLADASSNPRFRPDTTVLVRLMLENVAGPTGTAPMAFAPRLTIAAKTSTVRVMEQAGDESDANPRYRATMVAMFPALNPKYIALVSVVEPKGAPYAGVVCGPIVRELASIAFGLQKQL